MASDDLFEGLPPPAAPAGEDRAGAASPAPPPPPPAPKVPRHSALKSSLKRDKPSPSSAATSSSSPAAAAASVAPADVAAVGRVPEKRLRFRTTVDASEMQIIEAMQKITSHIGNPSKFSKASKLALQLIEAGSVKPETIGHFFAVLEAAMSSPGACNEPSVRADYQALFNAAEGVTECFNQEQKNQFDVWMLHAVVANDLCTDDSFVFSKAVGKIKDAISALPVATVDDDNDEAAALAALAEIQSGTTENKAADSNTPAAASNSGEESSDPFGLDNLLEHKPKKSEKSQDKGAGALSRKADEESRRLLRSRREALLKCLETAARRYRIPWTQTSIDILGRHAYESVGRFTARQREAVEKLWNSIKEQQIRRKHGKSASGKLDVNAFERLQEKYSHEKISIRRAVGGAGDRRATQWLG
ncbi:unnamed protein product [Triticum turgidum subsp. durum]|uniref:Uncharacterized protein n=1 Tax=Triticum turgidum subsp. durum TaxID=4567 RepID=A0A9R0YWW0_TRITD|nr:unnamed protein product [Triticum turgidum subsp. durum]